MKRSRRRARRLEKRNGGYSKKKRRWPFSGLREERLLCARETEKDLFLNFMMAKPEKTKSNSVNLPPSFGSNSFKIHPSNDPEGPPDLNSYSLEKFRLYETRAVAPTNFRGLLGTFSQIGTCLGIIASLFLAIPSENNPHYDHHTTEFHGATRAVGGCPVYVSDKPVMHDFNVLKKLVLPDGSILRGKFAGRPTRDCLFVDTIMDGKSLLKIWNLNKFSGVVGIFNCQGAGHWPMRDAEQQDPNSYSKSLSLSGHVSPQDIDFLRETADEGWSGDCAVYGFHAGSLTRLPREESQKVSLGTLECEIFTISPIHVGEEKLVLEIGRKALQHPESKPFVHDLLLSIALAECAIAKVGFEKNNISQGFEALARAQCLLRSKISLGKMMLLSQLLKRDTYR